MDQTTLLNDIEYLKSNNITTPVTVFNEQNMLDALSVLRDCTHNTKIYYAIKSCYNFPLLKSIAKQGLGAEILSELEFDIALAAGFKEFIVNGMGRSKDFLRKVAVIGKACIIIDTVQDIHHIRSIAEQINSKINVGIRFNLDLPIHGGNYYQTSDHGLGNSLNDELFKLFIELCREGNIEWQVLHSHFTINETNPGIYQEAITEVSNLLNEISKRGVSLPKVIDLGGGFEVFSPDMKTEFESLFCGIKTAFDEHLYGYTLVLEPGRYLSAFAGYSIGKTLDLKPVGKKTWIITDIGTNTLIPIPNARYEISLPQQARDGYLVGVTDGITSPSNNIVNSTHLKEIPQIGDYLVIKNTGAYTDVYSTFWAYQPHAVLFKEASSRQLSVYRSAEDIDSLQGIYLKPVE